MATRSNIAIVLNDDIVLSIYCHYDGYPEHHLPILTNHYNTYEKVIALICGGDISVLDERCDGEEGHSFNTPTKGQTIYYGRDRKESWDNVAPKVKLISNFVSEEYGYLFDKGEWKLIN